MDQNYTIRELSELEFTPLFEKYKKSVFEAMHSYAFREFLNEVELEKIGELGVGLGAPYKLYLAAFDGNNDFVGWSWGTQENSTTYYMVNSAVLPDHRRKGDL